MSKPPRLPPTRHLRTFESAARLGSFSAAAEELHTTQSAVSRTVADLEGQLGSQLFDRVHRGVRLTQNGRLYREAVEAALGRIGAAGSALARSENRHVVIACGHGISNLLVKPLRNELYRAVGGGDVHVHIMTCDYDLLTRVGETEADIVLSYEDGGGAPRDRIVALRQEATPMCAPSYAAAHAEHLGRPAREWGNLTLLEGVLPSRGWITWDDWFETAGWPHDMPRRLQYYDHVFLLEDILVGRGLALGSRRLMDRHLNSGALVAVVNDAVEVDRPLYARLTERGHRHSHARSCLDVFENSTRRWDGA